MGDKGLYKGLTVKNVLTLAFSTMIGWGWVSLTGVWVVEGGTVGAAIAFCLGAVLCIFVGLTYPALPLSFFGTIPLIGAYNMHFVDAKGILATSGGRCGMNLYRGCTHGCVYCDSRSRCYQFTHPFEDVEVKQNAPTLLEKALKSKRKKCMIGTGSMSDPYMHCEEELALTRRCLEIIRDNGFGLAIQTKSDRILRDVDLLDEINKTAKCVVEMTLTTYDDALCALLEPNVCNTKRRIEVLETMRQRGIPTVVWLTPILPFINDMEENVAAILQECVRVGVTGIVCFDMGLTLREGSREYFYAALDKHFPGMKERYIERYGNAYELPSPRAKKLMEMFRGVCAEHGILCEPEDCFRFMQELPERFPQIRE